MIWTLIIGLVLAGGGVWLFVIAPKARTPEEMRAAVDQFDAVEHNAFYKSPRGLAAMCFLVGVVLIVAYLYAAFSGPAAPAAG